MFDGASDFDQDLGWCVDYSVNMVDAFDSTKCEAAGGPGQAAQRSGKVLIIIICSQARPKPSPAASWPDLRLVLKAQSCNWSVLRQALVHACAGLRSHSRARSVRCLWPPAFNRGPYPCTAVSTGGSTRPFIAGRLLGQQDCSFDLVVQPTRLSGWRVDSSVNGLVFLTQGDVPAPNSSPTMVILLCLLCAAPAAAAGRTSTRAPPSASGQRACRSGPCR